ncbi:ATP-dependent Clp protease proteolytic subunit [Mesorhizobium newzealandense]|uniref:ATP-dependent Clp protease proteolytic subunit n=1 Tax=Mesorhizobium newzealandense TaxID=1300302 RepID=A0ABW4UCZ2_9HYPH
MSLLIHIDGEVNASMVERVRRDLARDPAANSLSLLINSHGGSIDDARKIYHAIRQHRAETKRARVLAQCDSAAVIVLMAADFRRAQSNSQIILHPTSINPTASGRWTARRYTEAAARCQRLDDEILDLMTERTGASRAALAREDATESPTPIPLAISLGIIHAAPGYPSRCSSTWPEAARAVIRSGAVIGLPTVLFSPAFFAACKASTRSEP